MKIEAVIFGRGKEPHHIHKAWLNSIGIKKFHNFTIFDFRKIHPSLGALNQITGFMKSLFIPKADVYILTGIGALPAVILNKILHDSKIITINSDTFFTDYNKSTGFKRKYMTWLISYLDGMISSSNWVKNISPLDIPSKVVYPYCDYKRFSKVKPNYKSNNVICVGTGINTKGTDIAINEFSNYTKKGSLFICGHIKPIKSLKIPKRVYLLGRIKPEPTMGDSSIFLNASRHEAFGVNILEGMSAGLPTIVTENCGAKELVDKRLVVKEKDIGKKILELQSNKALRIKLGKKSKILAKAYSKKKSLDYFKKAVKDILDIERLEEYYEL